MKPCSDWPVPPVRPALAMVTTLGPPGRVPHSAPARRPSRPSRHSRGAPSPTVPPRDPASAGEGKGWETPSGDQKVGLKVWCSSAPPRLLSPLQSSSRAGEAPVRSTSPAAVTSRLAIPAHLGPWPGFGTFEMPLRVERARGWLLRPSGGRGRAAESPPPAGGGEGERAGAPRGARPAAGWGQAARPPLVHLMWGVPRRFLDLSFPANHEQEWVPRAHVERPSPSPLVNCILPSASLVTDWTWAKVHVLNGPQFPLFVQPKRSQ